MGKGQWCLCKSTPTKLKKDKPKVKLHKQIKCLGNTISSSNQSMDIFDEFHADKIIKHHGTIYDHKTLLDENITSIDLIESKSTNETRIESPKRAILRKSKFSNTRDRN